jgi:hypothetical protein
MTAYPVRVFCVTVLTAATLAIGACGKSVVGGVPGAPGGLEDQQWSSYADPSEHAFTLDAPAGWQVTGGAQRLSAVDIRTGVVMHSPDGKIELFYGDPTIPPFVTPNPYYTMGGYREGSVVPIGGLANAVIEPYSTGQQFAAQWGMGRISKSCGQAVTQSSQPLPQLTQVFDMGFSQGGVKATTEAGDATFTCSLADGTPAKAYVFTASTLIQSATSLWVVPAAVGYVAPAGREAEARALLAHVVASFKYDPQWMARQQNTTMDVSAQTTRTNDAISQNIMSTWENKNASQDRAMAADTQARRGVVTVQDPVNGPVQVDNSYEHHWRGADGSIVGTHDSNPPAPGAQELPVVPPQ